MLKRTWAARSPVKLTRPHSGAHTAENRSEIAPEMAEISKGNGGGDNEILAKLQRNIEKAKTKKACYASGDMIKDGMKSMLGDEFRAVVAIKCYSKADGWARSNFPAGQNKYSKESVDEALAHVMNMAMETGMNPPLERSEILVADTETLMAACGGLGGFRRGRSCQHQSWVLSELIKSNARCGKKTYVAFLDVRKAYPMCRRAAMLERLYL